MIETIKAYKALVTRGALGTKNYEKVDITNQLELPIYDTSQRDGVLDTGKICLLNGDLDPLPQYTRIIIELYDDQDNGDISETIYRVVDNDYVENVCRGDDPIYRHTLLLVEITKILERRPVDNLTFTNNLSSLSHFYQPINPEFDLRRGAVLTSSYSYKNLNRFLGDFHYLGIGDEISTNIELKLIWLCPYRYPSGTILRREEIELPLVYFYVELPDGNMMPLSKESGFTYTMPGKHTFVQHYHDKRNVLESGTDTVWEHGDVWVSWTVTCVAEDDALDLYSSYNMRQVVDRVLKCHKGILKGIDNQEFFLDYNIISRLEAIKAPEFSITQGTLFEALSQIGGYLHAIPRLIPRVENKNNYSCWDTITFDFLNDMIPIDNIEYSLIDLENVSDEFAQNFVSNVQNATISNYVGRASMVDPVDDSFLSARTESEVFEISDASAIFKTRYAIRSIIRVIAIVNGEEKDITQNVLERAEYNLKSAYRQQDSTDQKDNFLVYEMGKKNISGATYIRKKLDAGIFSEYVDVAIKNIVPGSYNVKDLALRVEYVPYVNFKVSQYKTFIDKTIGDSTLYYNQQANEVDIEAYGENMHFALSKTGNIKLGKTQYFNHIVNAPHCGQFFSTGIDKYIVFQCNREISTGVPLKQTTAFSKNFQELYSQIAVKRAIRQYEISERECVERNIDIQEFCIADTQFDLDNCFDLGFSQASEEEKSNIFKQLNNGFGYIGNIEVFCNYLNGQISSRVSTSTICTINYTDNDGAIKSKNILCPTFFSAFGRAVVSYFSMDDNFSAGTYTIAEETETKTLEDSSVIYIPKGNYSTENYIKYSNEFGKADTLSFKFIDKLSADKSGWIKQAESYYLNDLDVLAEKIQGKQYTSEASTVTASFGYNNDGLGGIVLDKDNREKISVTCQLNFVTQNKNIRIYKAFVDTLPYICNSSTQFRLVAFYEEQRTDDDKVKGAYYVEREGLFAEIISKSATIVIPGINYAHVNAIGYGIITQSDRVCLYVGKRVIVNNPISPIYLMFRHMI